MSRYSIFKRYVDVPRKGSNADHILMRRRADNLLFQLKNYMEIGRLIQYSMSKEFSDGSTLKVSSVNEIDTIKYTIPVSKLEVAELESTLVMATYLAGDNRIYATVMGDEKRNYFIDLNECIDLAHVRQPMGFAVLEYDADYGVIFFMDGDNFSLPPIINIHMHAVLYHVTSLSESTETYSGTIYRKAVVEYITRVIPTPATQYNQSINLSIWIPPGGSGHLVNHAARGTYCFMKPGKLNLQGLAGELCCEIGYYDSYWERGVGICSTETDFWRTINYNDSRTPWDPYYNSRTHEAWVTTPGSSPKWSILSDWWEYISETSLRKKVFICLDEEIGSSIEATDLEVVCDFGNPPNHFGVPGPGWPAAKAVIGGYMPGGGNSLGRKMMRMGKYHEPWPSSPPFEYVCPISQLHGYIIDDSYILDVNPLPDGMLLSNQGKVGKELWEAKIYYHIKNKKKTEITIPIIDGTGTYNFGYPCTNMTVSYTGTHPRYPGQILTGNSIAADAYFAGDFSPSWYVITSFGCVRARR